MSEGIVRLKDFKEGSDIVRKQPRKLSPGVSWQLDRGLDILPIRQTGKPRHGLFSQVTVLVSGKVSAARSQKAFPACFLHSQQRQWEELVHWPAAGLSVATQEAPGSQHLLQAELAQGEVSDETPRGCCC